MKTYEAGCDWCGVPFQFNPARHIKAVVGSSVFHICGACTPHYLNSLHAGKFKPGYVYKPEEKKK